MLVIKQNGTIISCSLS